MLKTLEIENYQPHKSTSLEFHPGMNVITGISGAGKTAIMRAILWGLFNRPSGGDFKGWYCKDSDAVRAAFEFDDGWFVKQRVGDKRVISKNAVGKETRKWEGGKNFYEAEGGKYEALRSDVPQPIKDIANICEYNISTQHEKYFMLQDSPGDRAKRLNELVGWDIVDNVTKKLSAAITSIKQDVSKGTIEIASLEGQLEEMRYLTTVEELINSLTKEIDEHTKLSGRANTLSDCISKLKACDAKSKELKDFLKIEPEYQKLMVLITDQSKLKQRASILSTAIANIKSIETEHNEDVAWLVVEKPYLELMSLVKSKDALLQKRGVLQSNISGMKVLDKSVEDSRSKLISLINRYTTLLQNSKICPTCNKSITTEEMNLIAKSMMEVK